jgi:hypothetical protein
LHFDFNHFKEGYAMTMTDEAGSVPPAAVMQKKSLTRRLLIAVPLGIVFLAIGVAVYLPGMFLGGMMTDSCSGNAYAIWNVWVVYLWPAVLLVAALLPSAMVIRNKSRKTVLTTIAAGLGAGAIWYILYLLTLTFAC